MKNQIMFDCINMENMFFTVKILFLQTFNYRIFLNLNPTFNRNYFLFHGVPVVKHFKCFRIDYPKFFNHAQ